MEARPGENSSKSADIRLAIGTDSRWVGVDVVRESAERESSQAQSLNLAIVKGKPFAYEFPDNKHKHVTAVRAAAMRLIYYAQAIRRRIRVDCRLVGLRHKLKAYEAP